MSRTPTIPKLDLPPRIDPKPVREAAESYVSLRERHGAESQNLVEAEHAKDRAVEQDRQAHADAIRESKPAPGLQATIRAEEAIKEKAREVDALWVAATDAHRELLDAIERHRSGWAEKAAKRVEDHKASVREAIAQLERTQREWREDLALVGWLENFPDGRYKPTAGVVSSLLGANHEPLPLAVVLGALREAVDPPPKPTPPPTRPLTVPDWREAA